MPRRLLVVANETIASPHLAGEVRRRAGGDADVLVVAPRLHRGRLDHWLSSGEERARAAATDRLEATVAALAADGLRVEGRVGDPDPLQAMDDAVREFGPDEVVISTHPPGRSQWLERRIVQEARTRYGFPVTHLTVDLEAGTMAVDADRDPAAPPEEAVPVYHASGYDEAMRIRSRGFREAAQPGGWVEVSTDEPADGDAVVFAVRVPRSALEGLARDGAGVRVPAALLDAHGPPVETDISHAE
ncbi:MAG: hypothetical protein IT200_13035 [Thermoleophilia bacterium]|nr:hypothetical protein [Thermoleophilia bacterium]